MIAASIRSDRFHRRSPLATWPAAGLLLAATLGAQTAPAPPRGQNASDERGVPIQLDVFTVTGSHLRRTEAEASLPVTIIDANELDLRAASTMSDLFDTITLAEPPLLSELNVAGQDARGDNTSIDLRGIGSGSTLTLVNGRRMAPHPISQGESGVPSLAANINSIPSALISRVEILRDGASAIYGADAAAGVINSLLSRRFTGRTLTGRATLTQHGGGNEYRTTVAQGLFFNRRETHLSLALDYFHRDALTAQDRKWSRDANQRLTTVLPAPWNGLPVTLRDGTLATRDNDFDNRSSTAAGGSWIRGFVGADGSFAGARPAGNAGITTSTTPSPVLTASAAGAFYLSPTTTGAVNVRQTAPSRNIDGIEWPFFENSNKWLVFSPKTDRWQFAAFLDQQLTGTVALFGDLLVYHARSTTGRAPPAIDGTDEPNIVVGVDNPYNPFGSRFYHPTGLPNADGTPRVAAAPAEVLFAGGTGARPQDFRPKVVEVKSTAYRAVAGLRGRWWRGWEWESAALFSGAQTRDTERNNIRESRLRQALLSPDPARAFNPFGYTFRVVGNQVQVGSAFINPASVLEPLYDNYIRFARTELFLWDAKTSGQLWRLFSGGRLGVAGGVEVRYETYGDKRPPYAGVNPPGETGPFLRPGDNDFVGLSPSINLSSNRTVYSVYSEVHFPFVTRENRRPFLESLELSLAGRHERFTLFGGATKPKASGSWGLARWLKLRASYNESFRAPNLVQTNVNPLQRSVTGISDPYRSEVTGLLIDGSTARTVFRRGNDQLKPEHADSVVAGFVLDLPAVPGLSLTVDYWRLNQKKVIANTTGTRQLLRDELALDLETQRQLQAGTPIGSVDLGSGTTNYRGNPKVTRAPVTDADRAFFNTFNATRPPAEQRAPVGRVLNLVDDYINLGGRDLEGYEVGMQWRLPRTESGQLTLRAEMSARLRRDEQAEPGGLVESFLFEDGSTKYRGNFSATWRRDALSLGWFTSYYGPWVDTTATTTLAIFEALGRPSYIKVYNDDGVIRYLWRVNPWISHNATAAYRFAGAGRSRLRGVTVRGGVNNVLDVDPPVVDNGNGYQPGTGSVRGRQFYLEISKRF